MKPEFLGAAAAALVLFATPVVGSAQHHRKDITLHINTRWEECAFQLDPALTQEAWRQFTEEAALVAYLRPLTDARPLGRGRVEFSLLRWATAIDDSESAWNDTFVHPYEDHWLMEGDRLAFPGLMVRVGVSDRMDIGGYLTKNPKSNYGFFGGQIQHNIINDQKRGWAAAGRMSFVSLFGPEDVELTVLGLDVLASRTLPVNGWLTVSPYVGGSSYLSYSQEKSEVVDLDSEYVPGNQVMIGAAAEVYRTRLAVEVSSARVQTLSFKVGVGF
ncbi:MAG TPA: hypothetical protein VLA36_03685 [Longimicrobiales bacterium]|nr:hypothetical protein [Longimicrobiales bacterium]